MLHDVQCMRNNIHTTISPNDLKSLNGFIKVSHNCVTNMFLKHKDGTSHYFCSKIDMEWKNGMDYLPIYVTSLPPHKTAITKLEHMNLSSSAIRSSTKEQQSSSQ